MGYGIGSVNGKPERVGVVPLWVGANSWSSASGARMRSRHDGVDVRAESLTLCERGLNVTRSFCFRPDVVPEAGRLTDGRITLDPFAVSLARCETRTLQASTPERGDARA